MRVSLPFSGKEGGMSGDQKCRGGMRGSRVVWILLKQGVVWRLILKIKRKKKRRERS